MEKAKCWLSSREGGRMEAEKSGREGDRKGEKED